MAYLVVVVVVVVGQTRKGKGSVVVVVASERLSACVCAKRHTKSNQLRSALHRVTLIADYEPETLAAKDERGELTRTQLDFQTFSMMMMMTTNNTSYSSTFPMGSSSSSSSLFYLSRLFIDQQKKHLVRPLKVRKNHKGSLRMPIDPGSRNPSFLSLLSSLPTPEKKKKSKLPQHDGKSQSTISTNYRDYIFPESSIKPWKSRYDSLTSRGGVIHGRKKKTMMRVRCALDHNASKASSSTPIHNHHCATFSSLRPTNFNQY